MTDSITNCDAWLRVFSWSVLLLLCEFLWCYLKQQQQQLTSPVHPLTLLGPYVVGQGTENRLHGTKSRDIWEQVSRARLDCEWREARRTTGRNEPASGKILVSWSHTDCSQIYCSPLWLHGFESGQTCTTALFWCSASHFNHLVWFRSRFVVCV